MIGLGFVVRCGASPYTLYRMDFRGDGDCNPERVASLGSEPLGSKPLGSEPTLLSASETDPKLAWDGLTRVINSAGNVSPAAADASSAIALEHYCFPAAPWLVRTGLRQRRLSSWNPAGLYAQVRAVGSLA